MILLNQLDGSLSAHDQLDGSLTGHDQIKGTLTRGPYGIPYINGVPLVGKIPLTKLGLRGICYDKTENWNYQYDLIGQEGWLYIYSDYRVETNNEGHTVNVPSIKIGDGSTPLIDSPFITAEKSDALIDSIYETLLGKLNEDKLLVAPEDRIRWDGKVSCKIDEENPENLMFYCDPADLDF